MKYNHILIYNTFTTFTISIFNIKKRCKYCKYAKKVFNQLNKSVLSPIIAKKAFTWCKSHNVHIVNTIIINDLQYLQYLQLFTYTKVWRKKIYEKL